SPADVRPERLIAERVIRRLDQEFALHLQLRAVMWERQPLLASHHFQELITPPHDTDIAVVILWSRLGTPLPADKFPGPLSGGEVSGTEWEFEDALKSHRERNTPEILLYRKAAEPTVGLGDTSAARQRLEQKERVDAFFRKCFADLALPGMIGPVALARHAVLRPSDRGGKPIDALAAAMIQRREALPELAQAPLDYTVESLVALLRDAPAHAVPPFRQALRAGGRAEGLSKAGEARLVIVVDQLEELFTQDQLPQSEREAFVTPWRRWRRAVSSGSSRRCAATFSTGS